MYAQHFGLSQDPFSIAPDPRYLFMSERHREALAHLLYGVSGGGRGGGTGGGFVLLTGDIGTGKTTICRCFLEQIPGGCHVAYIFNPKLTVIELLQSICEEFHVAVPHAGMAPSTVKDYIDALNQFLLQSHAAGHSSVLIIDEAQNLAPDVLEQLRLLTNLETNERKLLQIVLIGQPELREMLARPELEQLAQRVIARFHLDALSEVESTQYIQHRLAVAGHSGALPFDRKSLQRIQRIARGVPRRINLLCGRALLGAWATGVQRVDRKVVDKAAAEVFGSENTNPPRARKRTAAVALGALVVIAVAALISFMPWAPQSRVRTSSAVAASAPQSSASSTVRAPASAPAPPPPAARPVEEVDALLARMPTDINTAWRELGTRWNLDAGDADPCQAATSQQLLCYRSSNLTVPLLRQLGRPGILTLQQGNGVPVYVLLVGLGAQTATLRVAQSLHTVRLVAMGRLWHGDFATYWRAPPTYSGELREGSSGPAIQRLAHQLDLLDGHSASVDAAVPRVLDAAMRERVRAFQRAQGLVPDGQPGPMTLMQMDAATGGTEPRLQTDQP